MSYLDAHLNREQLSDLLRALTDCVNLPVQLLDGEGRLLEAVSGPTPYCQRLRRSVLETDACQRIHLDAGKRAQALGDSYIFTCPGGLTHIAFPLSDGGVLFGLVLAGPFVMDEPDSTLLTELSQRFSLPAGELLELYDDLQAVPVVPPGRVNALSRLMYYLLFSLIPGERNQLAHNQEKFYQQSRINESIQMFKAQGEDQKDAYPYELEKELLTKVRTGSVQEAKGVLNELLGYVFFCEGNRMETMKNRALELCTLLSRIAIEGGAITDSIFRLNNQFLSTLQKIDTLEELCLQLQEIVEAFMETLFSSGGRAGNEAVRRAIAFIAQRYAQPITLQDTAAAVGLSPAYFSSLFHRCTGSSFREYLNQVRVEESKRLLSRTEYNLVDIAMAMGFTDQSYFTKVFKKYTGMTPKQFR